MQFCNKKSLFFSILCLFSTVTLSRSYRILGLTPFNARTHFIMVETLFKELAARGHEVDVVGHFPQKEKLPRYNDLSIKGSLPVILGTFKYEKMGNHRFTDWYHMVLSEYGIKICENAFNTTILKEIRESKIKYDLIITVLFLHDCMYGFAHHLQAPVVAVSTNVDFPWGSRRLGNPTNPSYIPVYFLPYESRMNLIQRIWNTIYYVGTLTYYNFYALYHENEMIQKFFGYNMPHLRQLINNYTSLILINTHLSINYVAPKVPNFVEVAGLHLQPFKPLPENIKKELETDIGTKYKGVIYVSFGSLMAVESFPGRALNAFCEAFAEMPYKVMWKANAEKLPKDLTVPPNVHFEKWMPQQDILCHPNVKVFVSHGGLMSTQETIYCGVPTLGIPIFADQDTNIENSKLKGFALKLYFEDITKELFNNSVIELAENPKYKENAQKYSQLFKDRPQSALDTAVYWTEYVMKYKGANHLKSVATELSWYQYFLIDVIAIIGLSIVIISLVFYKIIKILIRLIRGNKNDKKVKIN